MKQFYSTIVLITLTICARAQLANGGIYANFGVDGDTKAGWVKNGPLQGTFSNDDWFSPQNTYGYGVGVLDTTNASYYNSLLQGGANICFTQRMSAPLYAKLGLKLWLDAAYGRDWISTNPLFDSTVFTTGAKNGDNPNNWVGTISNVPDKTDLVDTYAHMRRNGLRVTDSLWLFTGVSTVGTSGQRYFDIELYKNALTYSRSTRVFTTAGPDAGHTQWLFDPMGNITQTGDMILAVTFTPGAPPVVDTRIWISQSTYTGVIPARFNFTGTLDGATTAFGYCSIVSKSGSTAFGAGIANYTNVYAADTTYSTPWGTEDPLKVWDPQYQQLQLVEMGLNLTRIGVDPALYTAMGLDPCTSLFSSIFFKSRSSASFTSSLQDFMLPLTFLRPPVMDYTVNPDTLRCNRRTGTVSLTPGSTAGNYTWQALSGAISGMSADRSSITVNQAGTYVVSASPAQGCAVTRRDTIVVPIDTFRPVATANVMMAADLIHLQLLGGDTVRSNYLTPFGRSRGLLWNWTGPNGFTSTIENPIADNNAGTYQLVVTEKRNGCTDTARTYASFVVLPLDGLNLSASVASGGVRLNWTCADASNFVSFDIERSSTGTDFARIGSLNAALPPTNGVYSFTDSSPAPANNYYRIRVTARNGAVYYSNVANAATRYNGNSQFYLSRGGGDNAVFLNVNAGAPINGTLVLYNENGAMLQKASVYFGSGQSKLAIDAPALSKNKVVAIVLYSNNDVLFSQKIIF